MIVGQYLCPKTGSYEGGSAGGASPAAHGVPDSFIQLVQRQDSMKCSLECTRQSWTQTQIQLQIETYMLENIYYKNLKKQKKKTPSFARLFRSR